MKRQFLKSTRPAEFEAIVTSLESLLAEGHTVIFRTQPFETDLAEGDWGEYVIIIDNEDGDTIAGAENTVLSDAMADAWSSTPEADTD